MATVELLLLLKNSYGPLRADDDTELVALVHLVRLECYRTGKPLNPTIRKVLAVIAADASVRAYVTRRSECAVLVAPECGWPGVQTKGLPGLLMLIERRWTKDDSFLTWPSVASFCDGHVVIHRDDAVRLFTDLYAWLARVRPEFLYVHGQQLFRRHKQSELYTEVYWAIDDPDDDDGAESGQAHQTIRERVNEYCANKTNDEIEARGFAGKAAKALGMNGDNSAGQVRKKIKDLIADRAEDAELAPSNAPAGVSVWPIGRRTVGHAGAAVASSPKGKVHRCP